VLISQKDESLKSVVAFSDWTGTLLMISSILFSSRSKSNFDIDGRERETMIVLSSFMSPAVDSQTFRHLIVVVVVVVFLIFFLLLVRISFCLLFSSACGVQV